MQTNSRQQKRRRHPDTATFGRLVRMGTARGRFVDQSQETAETANNEGAESAKGNGEQTKNNFKFHVQLKYHHGSPVYI